VAVKTMSENKDISKYVDVSTSEYRTWATEKFWQKLTDFNNVRLCEPDLDDKIKIRLYKIRYSQTSREFSHDNSKVTINYEYMIGVKQLKIKSITDLENRECVYMMENE
jgi:hypothetical protein